MRMNKKRSLIGYDPKAVSVKVEAMQSTFAEEKQRLEKELVILTSENSALSERIESLVERVSGQVAFEKRNVGVAGREVAGTSTQEIGRGIDRCRITEHVNGASCK